MARLHRFNLVNNICSPGLNTHCESNVDLTGKTYQMTPEELAKYKTTPYKKPVYIDTYVAHDKASERVKKAWARRKAQGELA